MSNSVDFFAIATQKFHIANVGTIAYFFDPEGNVAGLRQPETA